MDHSVEKHETTSTPPDLFAQNFEANAEQSLQQLLDKCNNVDDYFLESTNVNVYADKHEKVEETLLNEAKKVPWLSPAVAEYIAIYKTPSKDPRKLNPSASPNILVEKLANQVYKKFNSRFMEGGTSTTYSKRAQDLLSYVTSPADEKGQIAKAKEAKDWFITVENIIKKGRA